ncbi:MAG: Carbamoyl-phosphate synthase small chain [Myxococcaceae bacterium]|nr:Carbamoyl-phosphate synthase small chain [Myxococcaceae bacterium]
MNQPAKLVLADGRVFEGVAIGADRTTLGEVVFTTGMTGYQEVITDPSYAGQLVTMTAPQIGNTGTNDEDDETKRPHVAGFIVHELSSVVSNWRAQRSLDEYLKAHGIAGIAGVDTRALTRHIRTTGAQQGAIGTESEKTLHDRAVASPSMSGLNLADGVSTQKTFKWTEGSGKWALKPEKAAGSRHVVAIDYGVKLNILRSLVDAGADVTVVPSTASAAEVLALKPDGIFLSNGPGDPAAVDHAIGTIRSLLGKKPMFGICLGHQLLALAVGANTYKLKFGHRGLNQPVKELATGKIEITTQNHGFAVDVESTKGKAVTTHIHLNDGTCQGIEHAESNSFSVQYHPEASAGPHDAAHLFARFIERIDAAAR